MRVELIGIGLILAGFFLVFVSGLVSNAKGDPKINSAGGVFIGPFPLFGFGERKMFYFLWILALILFVFFMFLNRFKF